MAGTNGTPTPKEFLGRARTSDYRPSVLSSAIPWLDDAVYFRTAEVERMKYDPRVEYGLGILKAPVHTATWEVKAVVPEIGQFVDQVLKRLWRRDLDKCLRMLEYRIAGGEVLYKDDEGDGRIEFDELKEIHPHDLTPLQLHGKLWGLEVSGCQWQGRPVRLGAPRYWFMSNRPQFGQFYGQSVLSAVYPRWVEKNGRHGAIGSRRMWANKLAFSGGTIYYPPGETEVSPGQFVANQDLARQIVEYYENGGMLTLPSVFDEDGNQLWRWEPPQINGDFEQILSYPKTLDAEMLEGMGVAPEMAAAFESGSGYSGRAVPAMLFFLSCDRVVDTAIEMADRDVCKPLVAHNWQHLPAAQRRYVIEPKSLIPKDEPEGQAPPGTAPQEAQPDQQQSPEGGAASPGGLPGMPNVEKALSGQAGRGAAPVVMSLTREPERIRPVEPEPVRLSAAHAPKGGVTVAGKHFVGGEFIPSEVMEKATPEEKAAVSGGGGGHGYAGDEIAAMSPAQRKILAARMGLVTRGKTDQEIHAALRPAPAARPDEPDVPSLPPLTREEHAAALGELLAALRQGGAKGGRDPRGDLAHLPEGDRARQVRDAVSSAVAEHERRKRVGMPVHDLYAAVRQEVPDLSPPEFRAVLLDAHHADRLRLTGWPRMPADLPRPDLAPLVSGKVMGNASQATGTVRLSSDWEHYEGPRHGHGWKSRRTGKVVYQEAEPGAHEHGPQDAPAAPDRPGPPQTPRPAAAETPGHGAVATAAVSRVEPWQGGCNETQLVTFEDGSAGIFKPADGEDHGLRRSVPGDYWRREVAASEVARVLGVGDLVPETVARAVGGREGSVQSFVDNAKTARNWKPSKRYDGPEDLARAAAFDFVTMNTDRHESNWMLQGGTKLGLIDNGLSFPETHTEPEYGNSFLLEKAVYGRAPIPEAVRAWAGKEEEVKAALDRSGITGPAQELALQRLRMLGTATDFRSLWQAAGVRTIEGLNHLAQAEGPGGKTAPGILGRIAGMFGR
jgi:hypothetical protein